MDKPTIQDKVFSVRTTGITYRTINIWDRHKLLPVNTKKSEWRRFSLIDIVWIKILVKLRAFGVPLKILQIIRKKLFLFDDTNEQSLVLHMIIWSVVKTKSKEYLAVASNGNLFCGDIQGVRIFKLSKLCKHIILLDLNEIIQEAITEIKAGNIGIFEEYIASLNSAELQAMNLVRSGKYSNIEIILNGDRIERLEATEKIDTYKRIVDILKEAKFQEIKIQQANGKILSVKRTIKKKVW